MIDFRSVALRIPSKLNYSALHSDGRYEAPFRKLIGNLMYAELYTCYLRHIKYFKCI